MSKTTKNKLKTRNIRPQNWSQISVDWDVDKKSADDQKETNQDIHSQRQRSYWGYEEIEIYRIVFEFVDFVQLYWLHATVKFLFLSCGVDVTSQCV